MIRIIDLTCECITVHICIFCIYVNIFYIYIDIIHIFTFMFKFLH